MLKGCVICGFLVAENPDSEATTWVSQYRAVYHDAQESDVLLTGIGIEDDPASDLFFVPKDANARWDDKPSFQNRDFNLAEESEQLALGSEAFYFHASCWSLLERAYHPSPVPLRRLYEACKSLPRPLDASALSWGDDYGGHLVSNLEDHFPWEDHWVDQEYREGVPPLFYADPFEVPEAVAILEEPPLSPTTPVLQSSSKPAGVISDPEGSSSMAPLPVEICHQIAAYLTTTDALSARLASRSFQDIFYSQSFWLSRFDHDGERSWFLEAHDTHPSPDWRYLYHRTLPKFIGDGLRNRWRIWRRFPMVMSALNVTGGDALQPCETIADMELEDWRAVQGHVNEREPGSRYFSWNNGCRILYKQSMEIPKGSLCITTYFVTLGEASYICGIKVSGNDDAGIYFGYQSLRASTDSVDDLQGIEVLVGSRGIQALRYASTGGGLSKWHGDPTEAAQTHRLRYLEGIQELRGGFDGLKLTVLAARGLESRSATPQDLREAALWYPRVPEGIINYDSWFPLEKYASGFQPLFWSHFGGPAGCQLSSLTHIRGFLADELLRIEFFYGGVSESKKAHTFGRHTPINMFSVLTFVIDGPGGERITGLDLFYETVSIGFPDEEEETKREIKAYKFYTNKERTFEFVDEDEPDLESMTCQSIQIRPNTVITGLFGGKSVDFSAGTEVVGVISEPIEGISNISQ